MRNRCARWIAGALVALSCTYVGSASAAPAPIARGEITGHLYRTPPPPIDPSLPPEPDPHIPAPGSLVFLEREDGLVAFQRGVISDASGAYRFIGIPVGGRYVISAPGVASPICPHQMILVSSGGSVPPGTVLPTGLTLEPGSTPDVDLQAPPSCLAVSPAFLDFFDESIVAGGFLLLRTATESLDFDPKFTRELDKVVTVYDPPWFRPPTDAEVKMEFLDGPRAGDVVTAFYDGGNTAMWSFPDDDLTDGDHVRVFVDPVQLASVGLRANSPTSYELTYSAGTPLALEPDPDGGWHALEFQFVPIATQEGRVFCEQPTADGSFDGEDMPLDGYSVGIWDQLRSAPGDDPLQTDTTDAAGLFAFPNLPPGFYRVEVLGAHANGALYFTNVSDAIELPDPLPLEIPYVDETPPIIASATASPGVIWPPNHKMVHVVVTLDVTDECDPEPVCGIIAVTCTPADPAPKGKKAAEPNWVITGPLTVDLRAEKASKDKVDRVYSILIRCTDMSGNASEKAVTVTVPHDQGN